jgi:hypothetical protein
VLDIGGNKPPELWVRGYWTETLAETMSLWGSIVIHLWHTDQATGDLGARPGSEFPPGFPERRGRECQ